jgi:NADH-quinone oxidoreductase subunit A
MGANVIIDIYTHSVLLLSFQIFQWSLEHGHTFGEGAFRVNPEGGGALLWPLAVYSALVLALVAAMIGISYFLGERHRERTTGEPYESGAILAGSARVRMDIRFYLIAVFFVIFDLEAVFIFAWAVAVRELGWIGYAEALVFIGLLVAALIYLWRVGALETATEKQRALKLRIRQW